MSESERKGGLIAGIILIVIGVSVLLINLGLVEPGLFIAALGVSFLIAYVFWRLLGFLVAGMILTWLGTAVTLIQTTALNSDTEGAIVLVSLGLAFIFIYAFMGRKRHWWPLIPGSILLLLGATVFLVAQNIIPLTATQIFNIVLATVLILIGVWLVFRQFYGR